jgi:hypothetical protein
MGKHDKDKKNKKKDSDIVDFLFDNAGSFRQGLSEFMTYAKEVWVVLPEIISKLVASIISIINKIIMRYRSHMVLQMDEDIKHLDLDKELWEFMVMLYAQDNLLKTTKKIKQQLQKPKCHNYLDLIWFYVKKDKKDRFLSCCITQQKNREFVLVRNILVKKMKGDNYLEDVSIHASDEIYSKDIFTPYDDDNKSIKKKKSKRNRIVRKKTVSVVDSYKHK